MWCWSELETSEWAPMQPSSTRTSRLARPLSTRQLPTKEKPSSPSPRCSTKSMKRTNTKIPTGLETSSRRFPVKLIPISTPRRSSVSNPTTHSHSSETKSTPIKWFACNRLNLVEVLCAYLIFTLIYLILIIMFSPIV